MDKKCLIFLFFLFVCKLNYAQQAPYNKQTDFLNSNSIWIFGNGAGLDFNNDRPVPILTQSKGNGAASVSDPVTGKLLFYTDGDKVWDATHDLMPNGTGLLGGATTSSTSLCIVPLIDEPGKYYILCVNTLYSKYGLDNGTLFYSVVDMSLNDGLGDIVSGKKRIALTKDTLCSAVIAIPGNCNDIWLVVNSMSSAEFRAYHITSKGIDTVAVVSEGLGRELPDIASAGGSSVLATSSDRQRIAFTAWVSPHSQMVGEFDPATGKVSNIINLIGTRGSHFHSMCFSPDNSKLYLTFQGRNAPNLYQYDISNFNLNDILNSEKGIDATAGIVLKHLRLYNDTIYVGNGGWLHKVKQPNLSGNACDFEENTVKVLERSIGSHNLGNEVVWPLTPIEQLALDSIICSTDFTLEAPEGFDVYEWDDGTSSSERTVTSSGTYWVRSKDECYSRVDTFILKLGFVSPVINRSDDHELSTSTVYSAYQWLLNGNIIPDAIGNKCNILKNGEYQVVVSGEGACTDTSDIYVVDDYTHIPELTSISQQVKIYPNPSKDQIYISSPVLSKLNLKVLSIEGRTILKVINAKQVSLEGFPNGIYLIQVMDENDNIIKVEKVVKQ